MGDVRGGITKGFRNSTSTGTHHFHTTEDARPCDQRATWGRLLNPAEVQLASPGERPLFVSSRRGVGGGRG
jgi:hypothetical protein